MHLAPFSIASTSGPSGPAVARAMGRRGAAMLGVVGLALVTAACLRGEVEKKVAFDDASHAAWIGKGKSAIEGEGFIRRPNGWLARCSGGVVYLVPATPYFREWVEVYQAGNRLANARALNESHSKAIRKTQCDMQGRFAFSELPAGKWIAVTRVTYEGQAWSDDSTLLTEIETRQGETAKAILSNPNRI